MHRNLDRLSQPPVIALESSIVKDVIGRRHAINGIGADLLRVKRQLDRLAQNVGANVYRDRDTPVDGCHEELSHLPPLFEAHRRKFLDLAQAVERRRFRLEHDVDMPGEHGLFQCPAASNGR